MNKINKWLVYGVVTYGIIGVFVYVALRPKASKPPETTLAVQSVAGSNDVSKFQHCIYVGNGAVELGKQDYELIITFTDGTYLHYILPTNKIVNLGQ